MGTYAIDAIGTHDEYPVNAPFKCKVASVFRYGVSGDDLGVHVFFHTVEPVETPTGKKHLTALMIHTNKSENYFIDHINKGTVFNHKNTVYWTGESGKVTGDHVHLEFAEGHQTNMILNSQGVYMLENSKRIEDLVFFDKEFNYYSFVNGLEINLKEWDGQSSGGSESKYIFVRKRIGNNIKVIPLRKRKG